MRWLDWLLGVRTWMTYLDALWRSLMWPNAIEGTICRYPGRCRLPHRFAIRKIKGQKSMIVLVH